MCLLCFYRFSELLKAVLGDFLLNGRCCLTDASTVKQKIAQNSFQKLKKSDENTANTQQVRFFKLYFDFNVFSAENRRLFSIEFQLHTNSHITLWLPVVKRTTRAHCP